MRAIALVDLDDTLFQTLRKCPPDVAQEALAPIGFARDGSALSYATPRQQSLIAWLSETSWLVPVTARSRDALQRVRIRFDAAICAHGGMVIGEDGTPDAEWAARIASEAAPHQATLQALAEAVGHFDPSLSVRILTEDGPSLYLLIKHPDWDEAALAAAVAHVRDRVPADWTTHINGNNVALMPPFLGKRHAVEALLPRLRARHPDAPVIGIGDSLTDAGFMALCDFAMMPRGSQLSAAALEPLVARC
jgi:hydroxymethylpyrimidine pyrophosphatase-like HAD family hydrolase